MASEERGHGKGTHGRKDRPLCNADGLAPPQELGVGGKSSKKTLVVWLLRGDVVQDDFGSYAVFTEQDSSASQMKAAKVLDVIA